MGGEKRGGCKDDTHVTGGSKSVESFTEVDDQGHDGCAAGPEAVRGVPLGACGHPSGYQVDSWKEKLVSQF